MSAAMLEVRGLGRRFAGVSALDAVDFAVAEGSITSLIGPNGAGKTTLINLVSGVIAPTAGSIVFQGNRIDATSSHRRAALGIRRTFQTVHLFGGMSVLENLVVGRFRDCVVRNPLLGLLGPRWGDRSGRALATRMLAFLGLDRHASTLASDLPYGTQRRVEIARALMGDPRLLLLDEPAAGMNDAETERLRDDIRRVRDGGVTVFLVEHDMALVMSVSDRIVVLDFGRKIAEGDPASVQAHPDVIACYLGT